MRFLYVLISLFSLSVCPITASEPRTLVCDFDGDNASKVYKVVTAPGIGTTFRLPDDWKITDFVVTDPKAFHGESNGTIGIVTPLLPNKSTSVSIYTDNDRLFVFHLTSEPDNSGYVDQLVVVECSNLELFSQKVRTEAQRVSKDRLEEAETRCNASLEQKAREIKERMLFTINSDYEISDRYFSIDQVADDGIFTYIRLAKTQNRPVVYVGEKNDQKKLEQVKYTDEGEYYVVHRVLKAGNMRFFLKLGNLVSEIRRGR